MKREHIHEVMKILKEEFKNWNAPVVSLIAQKSNDPFKVLVCALLSTRTKDTTTSQVCKHFLSKVKNFEDILALDVEQLEELLYPVGFYRNKAKQLKALAQKVVEEFSGNVPDTLENLLKLPGVGRKVANLVLADAFKKPAICVDTHVHRISNRWGLVKTKTPEETEKALEKVLPKEYWLDYNKILVAFGQTICKPIKPDCHLCKISEYCDYYKTKYLTLVS